MHERRITTGIVAVIMIGMALFSATMLIYLRVEYDAIFCFLGVLAFLFFIGGIWGAYLFFTKPNEKYLAEDEKQAAWEKRHPFLIKLFPLLCLAWGIYQLVVFFLNSNN